MLSMTALNASGVVPAEPSIDGPQIVDPIFVSGVAKAKVIGGLLYASFFIEQPGGWQENCEAPYQSPPHHADYGPDERPCESRCGCQRTRKEGAQPRVIGSPSAAPGGRRSDALAGQLLG